MALSLVIGTGLGLVLVVAPPLVGNIAVTDPVLLGSVWFMRPQSLQVIVPPLLFLTIGAAIGVLGRFNGSVNTTAVVLVATVSAAFMLFGGAVVRRVTSSSGSRVAVGR